MIIASNTDLMQRKFRPDTYGTYIWHELINLDSEAEDMKCGIDDIDIDYDAFKKELSEWLSGWFVTELNDELPSRIQFIHPKEVKMSSPQYYNYGTDSINIKLKVNKTTMNKYIKENKKLLDVYLAKYESCSGFISYTPSSYAELIDEENIERVVMCLLDYILRDYEGNPMEDFDCSIVYENLIYN